MPIYEYECIHCGHHFELKQSFHDKPEAKCPRCKKKAKRVFHPTPVIFKGSGFYITDHRKSESSAANPASNPPATKEKPEVKKNKD
jgi:putative FmdB family regulatory protein